MKLAEIRQTEAPRESAREAPTTNDRRLK